MSPNNRFTLMSLVCTYFIVETSYRCVCQCVCHRVGHSRRPVKRSKKSSLLIRVSHDVNLSQMRIEDRHFRERKNRVVAKVLHTNTPFCPGKRVYTNLTPRMRYRNHLQDVLPSDGLYRLHKPESRKRVVYGSWGDVSDHKICEPLCV